MSKTLQEVKIGQIWWDKIGGVKILALIENESYIVIKRSRAIPFIVSFKEFRNNFVYKL